MLISPRLDDQSPLNVNPFAYQVLRRPHLQVHPQEHLQAFALHHDHGLLQHGLAHQSQVYKTQLQLLLHVHHLPCWQQDKLFYLKYVVHVQFAHLKQVSLREHPPQTQ